MVRERLNAIDVAAVVGNLRKQILDYNLVNIYDITNRVYVLKFSRNEDKKFVLFEIGHRIHTTQFLRNTDHLPSNFNVKLRKHLRTRKLRGINQIAQDRVVDFTFSSGEYAYHLIVQLFLPGNIYLTDYAYKVLTVLRPQNAGDSFFKVGETYAIPEVSVPWGVRVAPNVIEEALRNMRSSQSDVLNDSTFSKGSKPTKQSVSQAKNRKSGPNDNSNLDPMKTESESVDISGGLKDNSVHMLLKMIFPSLSVRSIDCFLKTAMGEGDIGEQNVDTIDNTKLTEAVEAVRCYVYSVAHSDTIVPGYLYKGAHEYEDFGPFDLGAGWERFDDINSALDAYFTKSEMKKIEKQEQPKKPIKLQKIKDDQNRREIVRQMEVDKLASDIEMVETNRDVFDTVLDLMRTLVASGASWQEIMDQLAHQRKAGHSLAKHIRSVNIPERRVDVCLPSDDPQFYSSGPSAHGKNAKKNSKKNNAASDLSDNSSVTLDYGLTCFQNLELMYAQKKRTAEKLERTKAGHKLALKRVDKQKEKHTQTKSGKSVSLVKVRKRMWFEKFHWFITSDGYLVLGGRDSTQNELLVKRYLTKGDLYFHADIHGASSCILKNPQGTAESHSNSIDEAACFAICLSSAWTQKMVVPAWWVHYHQVSRSAPTGEYLPHGSFMIRGKKNYVQPQRLEMAIGVVFHIEVPHLEDEPLEQTAFDQVDNLEFAHDQFDDLVFDPLNDPFEDAAPLENCQIDNSSGINDISLDLDGQNIINQNPNDMFAWFNDATSPGVEMVDPNDSDVSLDIDMVMAHGQIDTQAVGGLEKGSFGEQSADSASDQGTTQRRVRFNLDNLAEDMEKGDRPRFRRQGTGYPCKGFNPDDLVDKLSKLGILAPSASDPEPHHVRFVEAEKPEHSPEAIARLRQRMPTGIPGAAKKTKGPSRLARAKAAKAKKKYADDDEEIQQLRCQLTGSKLQRLDSKSDSVVTDQVDVPKSKPVFQRQVIKPLDDQELSSHMRQLRMLSRDPSENDVILSAIPMCAPYATLKDHAYHLKLVPGNNKKGAIASQALHHFIKVDESKAQYVKLITTDQFALTLIENCKVPGSASGSRKQ
ncbi:MJ1625 yease Yp1009cp-like domain, putative [Babesia ovis]|uniref:Ribosome quality control complex subunit 2 n=1 Tax=Babesia ovis TaxID=5869 RepID=A0A9W5WW00_BABOV|nr:MJ1625 yease Yp1009cp-like domain, putative [Babesia ovis]